MNSKKRFLLPWTLSVFLLTGVASLWAGAGEPGSPDNSKEAGDGAAVAKPASPEERMNALEATIRVLEARIRELEGSGAASAASAPKGEDRSPEGSTVDEAAASPATDSAPAPGNKSSFFDKIEFSGFADTYYGYNFNRPVSRKNGIRNFDFNHNQFSLNLLEFALERRADPLGFRFDLNFGDTAKWVHGAEPGGTDVYQYLQQAYVTYKAPLGRGLSVDFGKFVTHMGAEVIETHANQNYSRSLLFAWAIPYYHFGTRISYPISDKLSVAGLIVNGWNNVVENNSGKSVGVSVNLTPVPKLNLIQNYIVGAEQADNGRDRRQVFDTILTVYLSDRVTLMANYDYGMDRLLGERVRWQGIAGYARFQVTPVFAIAPRLEWFDDPQGFSTGLAQSIREATLTAEFKMRGGLLMRAEYRRDWSDRPFFEKRDGLFSRSQTTATMGLVYVLGQEP